MLIDLDVFIMIQCISKEASTRAKLILCFYNSRIYSEDLTSTISYCCPFYGDGDVVVLSSFIVAPIVCQDLC